ncbi:MAG: hypothetical protein HKN27_13720 [Silicimonas sp.]|nr:hypothetical protein [Silicimonas sp.]
MRTSTSLVVGLVIGHASMALAAEGDPLSAIDWLSNSIAIPEEAPAPTAPEPVEPPSEISVSTLDQPLPDRAGLVNARDLGIPAGLWGRSSAAELAGMIAQLPEPQDAPPTLRRFLRDLMVARLDPPVDAASDQSLYLARLDKLLALGQLDAAKQLIAAAGAPEPQRFRRAFDIALLTGTETEACQTIEQTPDISPTYPARVFCLARNGKWDVAALTLGNAEALGILTPEEDKLLLIFLDAELFENEPVPRAPRVPSPLIFRLYEAIGDRIPTDQLPVAFAVADLSDTVGWQARLRAIERLAAAGAVSVDQLVEVYSERRAAASGGIWDRVKAVRAAVDALERGDDAQVTQTLPEAWAFAKSAGYEAGFATWAAPQLDGLDLRGAVRHVAFEIALLAWDVGLAAQFVGPSAEDRFLLALAQGAGGAEPGNDPLSRAVLRGLGALEPNQRYKALLDDDRAGEAVLLAYAMLSDGAAGNPAGVADALTLLRALGLETLARQVAVELVLKEGAA